MDNPRLEQLTEELAERLLTVKGRKVYGYLPPRVKAIVDAIVEELAKDERVSAAYETWQTLYEQVCLDYDQRPPKRLPLSRQKEFRSVRNMVTAMDSRAAAVRGCAENTFRAGRTYHQKECRRSRTKEL